MTQYATAVIGAGVIGCLIARELAARDRSARITVLDRDAVGAGATRRSAGLHLPRGATPRLRGMSAHSHRYYAGLARRHPGLPFYPVGATVITDAAALHSHYLPQAAPVPVPAAAALSPAWRIRGAHYCDVHRLSQALAAMLRPRVAFREGVAVTGLEPGQHAVTIHTGTGERLSAATVVLAPGPWVADPAWRGLLAPLGLRVKKVAALHIEQRPGPGDEAVVLDRDDAFLLPLAHRGHWLLSYCCQEWDVAPGEPAALRASDTAAGRRLLRHFAPAMTGACRGGQVFCDAYSPAREPVVRQVADRIVFAGAASGSGYRLAPAIAAEAAELAARANEGVTSDHQYV
jgi:glycine/D-amino acid oxidase-like deaminating enzyme